MSNLLFVFVLIFTFFIGFTVGKIDYFSSEIHEPTACIHDGGS